MGVVSLLGDPAHTDKARRLTGRRSETWCKIIHNGSLPAPALNPAEDLWVMFDSSKHQYTVHFIRNTILILCTILHNMDSISYWMQPIEILLKICQPCAPPILPQHIPKISIWWMWRLLKKKQWTHCLMEPDWNQFETASEIMLCDMAHHSAWRSHYKIE